MKKLIILFSIFYISVSNGQVHMDLDSDRTPYSQWQGNPAHSSDEKL